MRLCIFSFFNDIQFLLSINLFYKFTIYFNTLSVFFHYETKLKNVENEKVLQLGLDKFQINKRAYNIF